MKTRIRRTALTLAGSSLLLATATAFAQSTTSPWRAAEAARPHAMAPLPTMPSRSCMCSLSVVSGRNRLVDWTVSAVLYVTPGST